MIGASEMAEVLSGAWGERWAIRHAWWRGARLLARNVRGRSGEVDLVLRHRGTLVFAEVKARRRDPLGTGLAAVTPWKQRRIVRTALEYMSRHGVSPDLVPCRFDVFVVTPVGRRGRARVSWIQDAFRAEWLDA